MAMKDKKKNSHSNFSDDYVFYYRKYNLQTLTILIGILGDWHKAEDINQDFWVKVYEKRKHFFIVKNIEKYLMQSAKYMGIDALKNLKKNLQPILIDEPLLNCIFTKENIYTFEEVNCYTNKNRFVEEAFNQLSFPQLEIFELFYNGISVKEIAEELNLKEGTVRRRLYHIRRKLKKWIKEKKYLLKTI